MASENTTVIDVIARLTDETSPRLRTIQGNMDRFGVSVERTRRQAGRLASDRHTVNLEARDRATAAITKVAAGVKDISGKTFHFTMKMIDLATKPMRSLFNFATSLKTIVAGVMAGLAIDKTMLQPINLADSYASAFIGFETLFKSQEKAQKMMNDIDKFAIDTPFKASGIIANSQKMIAMGWKAEDLITDMKILGDAAAATGKGDEGLDTIIRALSQIKTKGKLSTEELNQLAEAGIRAKGYLAEGLGYGTSDAGMAMLAKDLEGGAIGSEKAIALLLNGMKEYEGMMDKTANETVSGLKAQIEDAFEVNIIRKWGQGLQEGAKRGLGSVVALLDKSKDGLSKIGDIGQEIGAKFSNKLADGLDNIIQKLLIITDTKAFKEADVGGKIKILWGSIIADPFQKWWNSSGQQFASDVAFKIGNGIGSFFKNSFLAILGIKADGAMADGIAIGASFADGFLQGFNPAAIGKALLNGIKNIGLDASTLLPGGKKASGTSTLSAGILAFLGLKAGKGLGLGGLIGKLTSGGRAGGAASRGVAAGVAGAGAGVVGQVDDYASFWQNASLWNTTSRSAVVSGQQAAEAAATRMATTTQRYGQFFDDVSVSLAPTVARVRPALGKVAKFFKGNWLSVLFAGAAIAQADDKAGETMKQGGGILGSMGGTSIGMAIGTAIAPGIGTAIGGLIGSIGGYMVGEGAGKETYESMKSGTTYEERHIAKQNRTDAEERVNKTVEIRGEMAGISEQKKEVGDLKKQWNDVRWELNQGDLSAEEMAAKQAEMEVIVGRLAGIYPDLINMSDTENQKLGDKLRLLEDNLRIEEKRKRLALENQIIENNRSFDVVQEDLSKSNRNLASLDSKEKSYTKGQDKIENLGLKTQGLQAEKQEAFDNGNIALAAFKIAEIQMNISKINEQAKGLGIKDEFSLGDVSDGSYMSTLSDEKEKLNTELGNEIVNNQELKGLYQEMYDAQIAMIELNLGEPIEEAAKKYDTMSAAEQAAFLKASNDVNNLNSKFKELEKPKYVDIIMRVSGEIPGFIENRTTIVGPLQNTELKLNGVKSEPLKTSGGTANPKVDASGEITKKGHLAMIGEAGAEAVIPLTGTNAHRGVALWEQAGQMLGTLPKHAQGGIYGNLLPTEIARNNATKIYNESQKPKEDKLQKAVVVASGTIGGTYDKLSTLSDVTDQVNIHKSFVRPLAAKLPSTFGIQNNVMKNSKQISKVLSKVGGGFGKVVKKLPYLGTIIAAATTMADIATSKNKWESASENAGGFAGALAGAKIGALAGAKLGALFPSAAPGLLIAGGAVGAILGGIGGEKIGNTIYNYREKIKKLFTGDKVTDKVIPRYARGGIINKAHTGIVGEAGAEAIIPLSGTNKHRGKRLWEQAGDMLGMTAETSSGDAIRTNDTPIAINVGGMTFTFNGVNASDKEGIMSTIRGEMPQIANEMSETLAKMLTQAFSNMKLGAEGI